jgi:hypothetical protein
MRKFREKNSVKKISAEISRKNFSEKNRAEIPREKFQ